MFGRARVFVNDFENLIDLRRSLWRSYSYRRAHDSYTSNSNLTITILSMFIELLITDR